MLVAFHHKSRKLKSEKRQRLVAIQNRVVVNRAFMFEKLNKVIQNQILNFEISNDRKIILQPLIDYIQQKIVSKEDINLNFICTHNSRRSHLAQIWAKTAASYYTIKNVQSYSGGTKVTALFPKIIETLNNQGFEISIISETSNPVYAIKYDENTIPIIGFSKDMIIHLILFHSLLQL